MSNEYDYSGLYNHTDGNTPPQNPQQPQQPQPQQPQQPQQPEQPQNSYPNVGSSGMNTANTAQTDFSTPNPAPEQNNGYTSSFGGNGGNGGNGGYNGYSYSSAPQQPPKKPRNGKKIALRVLAGVGAVVLGFGGGFAGAVVASRTGLTGNQVVVQQVVRDNADDGATSGSTDGTTMSVQQIAGLVSPSVVAITTEAMTSSQTWFGGYYVQSGAGSGVVISQDGYILTCAHVVNGASSVKVQLSNGKSYDATIVGSDTTSDIAVLKVDADDLTPAVVGDSDKLAVGETAVAVGNPLGTLSNTVTGGFVSALNRQVTVENNNMTLIQTDASISPGNSGGGLFNGNGELIDIVNAKSASEDAEGIGFAIPINTAMQIAKDLIENGYVARPALGVSIYDVTDAQTAQQLGVSSYGVYVVKVTAGSGAEAAGVKPGDRILAIADVAVSSSNDVKGYLQNKEVGDTVTLQVERQGKVISLDVTLGKMTQ